MLIKCTCVLQCTSKRGLAMFCASVLWINHVTKCLWQTKYTIVHKYTDPFSPWILQFLFIKFIQKVVKKSEFMNKSEHRESRGHFLPCNLNESFSSTEVGVYFENAYVH